MALMRRGAVSEEIFLLEGRRGVHREKRVVRGILAFPLSRSFVPLRESMGRVGMKEGGGGGLS